MWVYNMNISNVGIYNLGNLWRTMHIFSNSQENSLFEKVF